MSAQPSPQRTGKRRHPAAQEQVGGTVKSRGELDSELVARRAYERFEARGREPGRDQEDWFNAERELRGSRGE
jgi:hypothetical protein